MATKPKDEKPEDTETEETEETETEETEDTGEEDNWNRMRTVIGEVFDERMTEWQAKSPKKTTSSRSPRKEEAPKRKQGFLTGGFFSSLKPEE